MSIEIEADFINKASDSDRYQIDPEKFSHLSLLIQDLLRLQISGARNKEDLNFFIEDHKIVVIYGQHNEQYDWDENSIETELIKGLELTINRAREFHNLIVEKGVEEAKKYNKNNRGLPLKAAEILSKLQGDDIKLVTADNSVGLPKIPKVNIKKNTYKSFSLVECSITKPELIGPMLAEFWTTVDKKMVKARLAVPDEYKDIVCKMAFKFKKVDIKFKYSENLKKSNRYVGTLSAISGSEVIDTNRELEF
tara:strand:- start:5981 stop:6733 length:753 start_codon:yes stop_codon:yes gene_type:complete